MAHATARPIRYLTGKGTLFYNGKIPSDTFIRKAPFGGRWHWKPTGTGGSWVRFAARTTIMMDGC